MNIYIYIYIIRNYLHIILLFLIIYINHFTGKKELSRRSQVIQRDLPRPVDVNMNILRPFMDTPLTDLQRV